MRKHTYWFLRLVVLLLLVGGPPTFADRLVLKSGKSVLGKLRKVTKTHVYFRTKNGKTYKISRKKIKKFIKDKKGKGARKRVNKPTEGERGSVPPSMATGPTGALFGARVGGNWNDASVTFGATSPNTGFQGKAAAFGYSFGMAGIIPLSGSLGLGIEAAYEQLGVGLLDGSNNTTSRSYTILEIPLILRLNLSGGETKVFAEAGGFFGLGLGATEGGSALSDAASIHYGIVGGIGIQYPLSSSMVLDVPLRFLYCLSDASTLSTDTISLVAFQLNINLLFAL